MKILGRILSAVLILIIVPLFTLSACNLAFERTMRNPSTYTNAFENLNIYDDLLPVTLPVIFQAARTSDNLIEGIPVEYNDITNALSFEDWRVVTGELVPPGWLKAQFEQSVDSALRVMNNDFTALDTPVDFSELKTRFGGDSARTAAQYIINAAPACTAEQITQLQNLGTDASSRLPVCNPDDEALRTTSVNYLVSWLNAVGNLLPEETVTVQEFYGITRQDARGGYLVGELSSQALSFLYLCPAALCALIVFFTVRSLKGFGRWMGCTGILTGIMILIMLALLNLALIGTIHEFVSDENDLNQFLASITSALMRSVAARASSTILIQAGVFIGIGFVLLAISFLVRAPDGALVAAGSVIIDEDGQVISTASKPRKAASDDTRRLS